MCIPALACQAALAQATSLWPNRSTATDGICAGPTHTPVDPRFDEHAVGEAFDLTHDPDNGVDTFALADYLKESSDSRIKYVISNGRIWNPTVEPWHWRTYNGPDPHTSHVHVSILHEARDDVGQWWWPIPSQEEDIDMVDYVVDVPWLGANTNGTDPFFRVREVPNDSYSFEVISYNNAPHSPTWVDGFHAPRYEDYLSDQGLWARKWHSTTGKLLAGAIVKSNRIAVACEGGGTYGIAHE